MLKSFNFELFHSSSIFQRPTNNNESIAGQPRKEGKREREKEVITSVHARLTSISYFHSLSQWHLIYSKNYI
jgi:hypothetical protein